MYCPDSKTECLGSICPYYSNSTILSNNLGIIAGSDALFDFDLSDIIDGTKVIDENKLKDYSPLLFSLIFLYRNYNNMTSMTKKFNSNNSNNSFNGHCSKYK